MATPGPKRRPGTRTGVPNFTEAEFEVIDRFARALAAGKYRTTGAAAPDCRRELEELRGRIPSLPLRSVNQVRRAVDRRAGKLGLVWALSFWSPAELELVREYAKAIVAGRFASASDAARVCCRHLARELGRKRSVEGTCWHLRRALRALGVPARQQDWTRAELRVVRRFLRKAYSGRPCTVKNMSEACSRALGGRRSADAVRTQMKRFVAEVAQPRFHGFSLPWEKQYFERYALKVAEGKLPNVMVAARECLKALELRQKQESRKVPGRTSPSYKRDFSGVYSGIQRAGQRLGLPRAVHPRWNEKEDRILRSWRKWYQRYRGVRRLMPQTQAAHGLQSELADKGYLRTFSACYNRIAKPDFRA